MNKKIFIALTSFVVFSFFNVAYASPTLNIDAVVDVPQSCTVSDTANVTHSYGGTNSYLAICALDAATKNGSISNPQLSNQYPSLGLFVTAINGVTADPNTQYWALYQNGSYAISGMTLLTINKNDTIMLQLRDFSDNNLGSQVVLHIHSLLLPAPATGSGPLLAPSPTAPVSTNKITFDLKKAFDFLANNQNSDGSFGESMYTDWAGLALSQSNKGDQVLKLVKYFEENTFEENTDDKMSLTDNERHTMALMSLGLNPYNTNKKNYIEKIVESFDGTQYGNKEEDNDDIFALIVLQNAGYQEQDVNIKNDISFILSRQNQDGSWDNSVDMTGAGIEALSVFNDEPLVKSALIKAENYLRANQKNNGGWNDNASSTAWVIEGINALNEQPSDWIKNGNTPLDYLASLQDTDGGIRSTDIKSKIWITSYVTLALSQKTWNQVIQKFDKVNTGIAPVAPSIPSVLPETTENQNTDTGTGSQNTKINFKTNNTLAIKNNIKNSVLTANTLNAFEENTKNPAENNSAGKSENWFFKLLQMLFRF